MKKLLITYDKYKIPLEMRKNKSVFSVQLIFIFYGVSFTLK
jgi:hypothetical protein